MTVEELLKPRYKQINDWPFMGTKYQIGKIFTFENLIDTGIISAYPHLFKKLEWYEERKPEDMPEYIKTNFKKTRNWIKKVNEWDKVICHFNDNRRHGKDIAYMPTNEYLPATKEEYESYQAKNQANVL